MPGIYCQKAQEYRRKAETVTLIDDLMEEFKKVAPQMPTNHCPNYRCLTEATIEAMDRLQLPKGKQEQCLQILATYLKLSRAAIMAAAKERSGQSPVPVSREKPSPPPRNRYRKGP